jgi:phosphoglucosamine mutase
VIANGLEGVPTPSGAEVGRVIPYDEAADKYAHFIQSKVDGDFNGIRVVADCANGAASYIAPKLLRSLGADVVAIFCKPDGININDGCGSTHLEQLRKAVVREEADLGIAYDGDADRLLAVDEEGNVVDGDKLLLIFGSYLDKEGLLKENTIVITVMSNLGLKVACKERGIQTLETAVGDRYVIEGMKESGAVLGGEQSGHIVFGMDNTTGDGILSSVKLLQILKQSKRKLSALANEMEQYPQILINVPVKQKQGWENKAEIKAAIDKAEAELGDTGRVLVRASGTENLLRVMVEGKKQEQIERLANEIADVVKVVMSTP